MATRKTTTPKRGPASSNPEDMVAAGLADNFIGTVTEAKYIVWDYGGRIENPVIAAAITLLPESDSGFDEFTQVYSIGDLKLFVPSRSDDPDDNTYDPDADLDDNYGYWAMPVGSADQLNKSSNYAHFLASLVDAEFPVKLFSPDIRFLEGLKGEWNRVAQKKRSGIIMDEDEEKESKGRTILVCTEVIDTGASSGKKKAAPKVAKSKRRSKKAGTKTEEDSEPLEDRAAVIILAGVVEAGADGLSIENASALLMREFAGAEKRRSVKLLNDETFLGRDEWYYEADDETLYEAEEVDE